MKTIFAIIPVIGKFFGSSTTSSLVLRKIEGEATLHCPDDGSFLIVGKRLREEEGLDVGILSFPDKVSVTFPLDPDGARQGRLFEILLAAGVTKVTFKDSPE